VQAGRVVALSAAAAGLLGLAVAAGFATPHAPSSAWASLLPSVTLATVVIAGVADGFNPCAFTVLLLFITSLLAAAQARGAEGAAGLRARVIALGSVYIAAVFLTYLALGIGLLSTASIFTERHLDLLQNDILVKVDRAAMSTSLETRVPLLDHRVVEFAWQLPISIKYKNSIGKWPLKQILYKYIPEQYVNRPKMGFGVPIDHWLRGSLLEWAEELLGENRIRSEGFFDPVPIRSEWKLHLSGRRNRHHGLWIILMFQAWYDAQKKLSLPG